MVLRQSIEKLLAESESSFGCSSGVKALPNSEVRAKGEALEFAVCEWLKDRGYYIALRRFRTPFAEIDIIAMSAHRDFLLIEVKSSLWPDDCALNLSQSQRQRLMRACSWVTEELTGLAGLPNYPEVELLLVVPEAMRRDSFQMIAIF
ncbi:MAG: YraN family protein [Deltaproteobacteria bacterium]|nr:YraN family protein [Deltaproteobacteria bacterium]